MNESHDGDKPIHRARAAGFIKMRGAVEQLFLLAAPATAHYKRREHPLPAPQERHKEQGLAVLQSPAYAAHG
jgi:hypothetical protein